MLPSCSCMVHSELLNSLKAPHQSHQSVKPSESDKSRSNPKLNDSDVTTSRSFVFCLLRARGGRARAREGKKKKTTQQSNKKEEQWRHWIAKYQVRIPSFASLGLPSLVRLNYVLLTVSSRLGCVSCFFFADKLSGVCVCVCGLQTV